MPSKQSSNHLDLRYFRFFALTAGAVAIIVGIFVLLGWMFDVSVLKSVLPGKATMKPNAALCFVLCGVALALITVANGRRGGVNRTRTRVAFICSGVAAIASVATLSEYLFALDLNIDSLLFRTALLTEANDSLGGRMAGATALAFALLGIAMMLRDARSRIGRLFSETFSLATMLVGMMALIGYAYGVESLYDFYAYRSMAIHTALLFFVLGLSSLFARPKRGLIAVIISDHTGGLLARRVLPLAVLLPFLLGWLRLAGQRAGLYGTEFGLAIFATSNIIIFAVIIWLSARLLNRIDSKRRRAAEQLRSSEESFRQLADAMPQIVWTSRSDGWLDYYNQRWFDYTGMTLEQTEGAGWGPVLHPDDLQHCIDTWGESVRTGKPYEIKYRFKRVSDGVYRWHLGRASAIRDEHGQIMKWFGTCTDIDDQKRAEEVLESSQVQLEMRVEERTAELEKVNHGLQKQIAERRRVETALLDLTMLMGTILDSANYTIISTDVNGTIRTFNQAAERLLGYSAEEMIGKQTPALIHDPLEVESKACLLSEELGTTIEPGFEVVIAKARAGGREENEWSYIRKDGSRFPVLLSVTALHNHDGLITGYLGIGSDITERKRAEEKLRASEERFRNFFELSVDIIGISDFNGHFQTVNDAFTRVLGYSREELLNRPFMDFVHPDDVAKTVQAYESQLKQGEPVLFFQNRYVHKNGTAVCLEWTARPNLPSGLVFCIARDVTERENVSEELRKQAALLDLAHDAILVCDLERRITFWNRGAEATYGWTAEAAMGQVTHELFQTRHPASLEAIEADLLENGKWEGELTHVTREGLTIVVASRWSLQRDEHGVPSGILEINSNITERKHAEEALRKIEDRYRQIVNNANDIIYRADREGHFTFANPTAARYMQRPEQQLLGLHFLELVRPDYHKATMKFYDRQFKDRIETTYFEFPAITHDGGEIWVGQNVQLILDDEGDPSFQAVARDITERKRIERELSKNEEQLVEAQHIALLGSWEWDIALNKTSWSAALYSIYGIQPADLVPSFEGYLGLVHPDDRDLVSEAVTKVLQERNPGTYEHRIIFPDKSVRHHHVNVQVALGRDGQPIKLFGTAQDITDRVNLEDELKEARDAAIESARLKSEFLATMSHEIRTPMNGVIGMTALLLDSNLDADQSEVAETIRTSGEALLTIINDILDFSKIEAGKLEFEIVDFDLRNVVEETVELLAERARAKGLEFASLIYRDVPTGLRGDPGRLRQVLTNLVGNALKFTEQGEVIVRAEKENESETALTIRFTISDTGIGISEAAQSKLFQAFTQADGSTTRKYGGTGLGLSISKQLVEMMGGKMGVTSTPGAGSIFWFTVNLEKQPQRAVTATPPLGSLDKLRALIVDNNATNRQILSHQLGSWGMIHNEAESGSQALALLKAAAADGESYDLVILDLLMPGMDGFELARAIKSDPNTAKVHLVLLTSAGVRGDSEMAIAAGIAAYLTKPVRQAQLFACLTMVVSNSSPVTGSNLVTRHTLREASRMSSKLILLADDNMVNQKVAVRQLQKLGYRADAVANGYEAIEALSRIPYDLVLMDCQMPELDGYEATAEIRRLEGSTKRTPIVAMTANALTGDREKSIAAGMDDHITKPVKQEALARVLDRFFARAGESVSSVEVPAPPLPAPVDLDRLHEALGDDPEAIQEILGLYRTEMAEGLFRLDAAISSGNAGEINMIAHNCAGTSANCGMVAVVEQLRELERMGRENQLVGASDVNTQVGIQFERIKVFLDENFEPLLVH